MCLPPNNFINPDSTKSGRKSNSIAVGLMVRVRMTQQKVYVSIFGTTCQTYNINQKEKIIKI